MIQFSGLVQLLGSGVLTKTDDVVLYIAVGSCCDMVCCVRTGMSARAANLGEEGTPVVCGCYCIAWLLTHSLNTLVEPSG